jgi:hypothetical protein
MATAPLGNLNRNTTLSGRELLSASCEVRVWGMDTDDKPFIQPAIARHMTEKGALLTGVLPVKMGDVIGIRYQERKARFKISWVSDQDAAQTRSVGVDCLEEMNLFGTRKQPIPIEATSTLYSESKIRAGEAPPNRRKAERYTCRVAADVTMENSVAQAHASVTDISRKGCYLQMVSPFAAGSGVVLSIYGADPKAPPLVLRGAVRTSHPMVGMGVEFAEVGEADLRGIQAVLAQLGGAKPSPVTEIASAVWVPAPVLAPVVAATMPEMAEMQPAIEITDSPARELALRIRAELQQLEAEIMQTTRNAKAVDALREAAVQIKTVLRCCPE